VPPSAPLREAVSNRARQLRAELVIRGDVDIAALRDDFDVLAAEHRALAAYAAHHERDDPFVGRLRTVRGPPAHASSLVCDGGDGAIRDDPPPDEHAVRPDVDPAGASQRSCHGIKRGEREPRWDREPGEEAGDRAGGGGADGDEGPHGDDQEGQVAPHVFLGEHKPPRSHAMHGAGRRTPSQADAGVAHAGLLDVPRWPGSPRSTGGACGRRRRWRRGRGPGRRGPRARRPPPPRRARRASPRSPMSRWSWAPSRATTGSPSSTGSSSAGGVPVAARSGASPGSWGRWPSSPGSTSPPARAAPRWKASKRSPLSPYSSSTWTSRSGERTERQP
jgi:hypothetical protein